MNDQPTVTGSRHETILVGVDGSAASGAAVRWAAAEADRRNARLHAVHVVEPGGPEATPPGHDVRLQGSKEDAVAFLMYPQAETGEGRKDSLDPDTFKYKITSRELGA